MKASKEEKKSCGMGIALFLLMCLPVTWILMGIGIKINENGENAGLYNIMMNISVFMPAVAGIIACLVRKEGIGSLMLLPRLKDNGALYLVAIFGGAIFAVSSEVLNILILPDVEKLVPNAMPDLLFTLLLYTVLGVVGLFGLLGEEIGWMGYLYPKMEKVFGISISLVLMGVVRGLWHIVMIIGMSLDAKTVIEGIVSLSISNILLGSVLVYFTKKSGSIIPACIIHALTNTVPGALMAYIVINPVAYELRNTQIQLIGYIPAFIVGGICYVLLLRMNKKENINSN